VPPKGLPSIVLEVDPPQHTRSRQALEGEVVLKALAAKVRAIEMRGEPTRRFNNTLRCLQHLPVRPIRLDRPERDVGPWC